METSFEVRKICSRCNVRKEATEFKLCKERRFKKLGNRKPFEYLSSTCKECEKVVRNKNYFKRKNDPEFKKKWLKAASDYHKRHRDECLKKMRTKRGTKEYKDYRKKYGEANKKRISEMHKGPARKWHEYQRDNITDTYCKTLIRSQNGGKAACAITPEMIEQKRIQIKIKRKIYEIKREIEPSRSNGGVDSVFPRVNLNGRFTQEHAPNS